MKLRKALKATIVIITILLMDALIFINTAEAISPEKYNLEAIGGASTLLKYKGEPITSFYVGYAGKLYNYPAYCLDKNKKFVTKELSYTVTENGEITDVMLWRYIVNGYPYKKISELGCKERNEAYVATQQAIYVYLYNQKIEDYEAIGEAGKRTLEAMKLIIENAKNTEETPASKAIEIKCIKNSRSAQTVYEDLEGNEINVNDGKTFIQICPIDSEIEIEGKEDNTVGTTETNVTEQD